MPADSEFAPAKVNLELRVGAPRADGYHELATVFHAVGLFDEVQALPADGITLTVLAHEPHHQPWHLYGAAFIDSGEEPDVALPVVPLDAITQLHVW